MSTGFRHDQRRRSIVRAAWARRAALALAAVSMLLPAMPQMAEAVCCVCEGVTTMDGCAAFGLDCDVCSLQCATVGGTVRACCDAVTDCGAGVADTCGSSGACYQTAVGPGFCDGTCTDSLPPSPTATVTITPTETLTVTPTVTGTGTPSLTPSTTPTPQPNGSSCAIPGQCSSTFCADGVCCDTACTGPLEQCDLPGQAGTCASTAAGAPALTPWGLLAAAAVLAGVAGLTLRRRLLRS